MDIAEVKKLYMYNDWANARILQTAEQVSAAQLIAPTTHSHGDLRNTLIHTLNAEWTWRVRWQGVSPTTVLSAADLPTLQAIRVRWQTEEQHMWAFLDTLHPADLVRMITYTTTKGVQSAQPLWQLLLHVVLHGMQHRSEMAAMLTAYGYSPGDIDFIVFVREQG